MAHALEIDDNGAALMAWTNEVPWHGLGVQMDPKATPDEWMKAAGLDWRTERVPMFAATDNGMTAVEDYGVLVRSSDGKALGPCGKRFVPTQNADAFLFLKRFTEAGSMTMETCGSLKGGTEIWALARFRDDFDIVKGDTLKGYLLIHIAHVWGKGNRVQLTPIRVVCNNTLTMALNGKGQSSFSMSHLYDFNEDIQNKAIEAIGLADHQLSEFREAAQFLSSKEARPDDVAEFVARTYQPQALVTSKEAGVPIHLEFKNNAEMVFASVFNSPGAKLKGAKGTWWGAVNGVTYFEDHKAGNKPGGTLHGAWFGPGAKKKRDALELATEYAKVA